MFQAMRRVVGDLTNDYLGEGTFERTIRQSFLGMVIFLKDLNFLKLRLYEVPE